MAGSVSFVGCPGVEPGTSFLSGKRYTAKLAAHALLEYLVDYTVNRSDGTDRVNMVEKKKCMSYNYLSWLVNKEEKLSWMVNLP